ncbi:MAG: phage N-6-adenine-methyltransferase [Anaeroplasma bactoclasticum]|nr:phage N-6-adenine-methyltransferase [Anaeroplasma bactoclasticum]
MNKVLFSKKSDDWSTPKELYDLFMANGFVDPCPLRSRFDGLKTEWPSGSNFYINPPYSNIAAFVDFAINQLENNNAEKVVLLVPSRTDTKWFSKLYKAGCLFVFIKGRLKFGNCKNSAPFPSVLIHVYPITGENKAIGLDLQKILENSKEEL